MKAFAALPLLALAGCSVCQPTRFTRPVFDEPLAASITASDSGTQPSAAPEPATSGGAPAEPAAEQPSAPSTETPSPSTETPSPSTETPSAPATETPATQTPSAPASSSTNDGVGGQQETREESHDRG